MDAARTPSSGRLVIKHSARGMDVLLNILQDDCLCRTHLPIRDAGGEIKPLTFQIQTLRAKLRQYQVFDDR
jgi:hypothetical protein